MYSSFFIHSSVDGHLGCFHVLALLNSAVVNIRIHVSFSNRVSPVIFNLSYSICHCWLFFNSSRSLLNISCIFSICVSSLSMPPFYFQKFGSSLLLFFWIIFLVDFLFTVQLFNPVGFNHVPSSSGCFSVTSFRLICCVWDLFLAGWKAVVPVNYGVCLPWVGLDQWLLKVFWLGGFVFVFWWVELDLVILKGSGWAQSCGFKCLWVQYGFGQPVSQHANLCLYLAEG